MVFSLNCFAAFAARRALLFLLRAVYVVVSILLLRRSVAGVKGRWFVSVWGLASPQPTTERKEISTALATAFGSSASPRRIFRAARDGGVVRESSQISPNQSFPPSRAARRFGLRFAFSNARPPLPPPRAAFCETRPNFGCIVVKPRGAGALVRPHSCATPNSRTFQRDGRDAVGLRSTLAAAFGGALRAVHIPKTERGSFPTKPSLPKNCRARFSAFGGRLALFGTLPRVRGARRAESALAVGEGRRCRGLC